MASAARSGQSCNHECPGKDTRAGGKTMRKLLLAATLAASIPFTGHAQTAQELLAGSQKDTANVLNYGMGYNLQRYSPLTQINRDTVKHLVPVWNYSYDDNKSEE